MSLRLVAAMQGTCRALAKTHEKSLVLFGCFSRGVCLPVTRWEYFGASFVDAAFDGYASFYYSTATVLPLGSDMGNNTHPVIDPTSSGK